MASYLTPQEILSAHQTHGNDFVQINWVEKRQNKEGNTDYHNNFFKKADGTLVPAYVRVIQGEITGCRPPENRGVNGPRIGFKKTTIGYKESPIGEALYLVATAWKSQVDKHCKDPEFFPEGLTPPVIKQFHQAYYNDGGKPKPFDVPITYVKFRPKRNATGSLIDGEVKYLDEATQKPTSLINGSPITMDNIHEIARARSKFSGILNFNQTVRSSQGYSNWQSVVDCYLQIAAADRPQANYSADELEALGLGPSAVREAPPNSHVVNKTNDNVPNKTNVKANVNSGVTNPDPFAEANGEDEGDEDDGEGDEEDNDEE